MPIIEISDIYARQWAVDISDDYFGTVVKSGINAKGVYGNYSSRNGLLLEDMNNTTLSLDALDIGSIRYPGGTESRYFRIGRPEDIAGLHRAIDYCADHDLKLNFTLNDTVYIKNQATQDVFLTSAERAELAQFIQTDLIGYAASQGVEVESIHIGNEFQGRAADYGVPAWAGYAKVSGVLINELDQIFDAAPSIQAHRPDFVIQPNNWASEATQDAFVNILMQTIGADGAAAATKVDAIDVHGAGSGGSTTTNTLELTWEGYFGLGDEKPYKENIARMVDYWRGDANLEDIGFRNDAWAYADTPNLKDAALGMLQIHTASEYGFDSATNYIGYGPDASALVHQVSDQTSTQLDITAGGALFQMMSTALNGTKAVNLHGELPPEQEALQPILTRVFESEDRIVMYLVNRLDQSIDIDLDTADLTAGYGAWQGRTATASYSILGSENPTLGSATPISREGQLDAAMLGQGGTDFTLSPYEIAQITITPAQPIMPPSHEQPPQNMPSLEIPLIKSEDETFQNPLASNSLDHGKNLPRANDIDLKTGGFENTPFGENDSVHTLILDHDGTKLSLFTGKSNKGYDLKNIENVIAGAGEDSIIGNASRNTISGRAGDDYLSGFGGDDMIHGNAGHDKIVGGKGRDTLVGGAGIDEMYGGSGRNTFLYFTPLEGGDVIHDFKSNPQSGDVFSIRAKSFGDLEKGQLDDTRFASRQDDTAAQDEDDRFVYRGADQTLWFDMDGTGQLPPSLLAKLDGDDEDEETTFSASLIWLF